MTRHELKAMLADYLGDEFSAEQKEHFEAALDADPEFAAEVDGLKQTLQLIRSLEEPQANTDTQDESARSAVLPRLLSYAAVLVFAFIGGYLARGPQNEQLTIRQQDESLQTNFTNPSDWKLKFARQYAQHQGDSSLARSLVALARSSDQKH